MANTDRLLASADMEDHPLPHRVTPTDQSTATAKPAAYATYEEVTFLHSYYPNSKSYSSLGSAAVAFY